MSAAAVALLDTRADRAAAVEAAAAPLDYEYLTAAEAARAEAGKGKKKKERCAIARANKAAERYINGRRGLNLADRGKTVYIEDLAAAEDGRGAEAVYKRAGAEYAALADIDGYISSVAVARCESILARANLTTSERRRLNRYISGLSFEAVAAAENVTKRAAAKSIYSARDKVLTMLKTAADRARAAEAEDRAAAFDRFAAELIEAAARPEALKPAPLYTSAYRAAVLPAPLAAASGNRWNDLSRPSI